MPGVWPRRGNVFEDITLVSSSGEAVWEFLPIQNSLLFKFWWVQVNVWVVWTPGLSHPMLTMLWPIRGWYELGCGQWESWVTGCQAWMSFSWIDGNTGGCDVIKSGPACCLCCHLMDAGSVISGQSEHSVYLLWPISSQFKFTSEITPQAARNSWLFWGCH